MADPDDSATRVTGLRDVSSARQPTGGEEPELLERPSLDRIGRFIVLRQLGEGGMGVVYAGYDADLDRKVAIKLIRPRLARSDPGVARQRMQREAQTLARLSHDNVVQIYEVGQTTDHIYIAMEFVAGETLRAWLTEPRPWRQILAVIVQAGRGLAAAHRAGIIHRDFKPDNVLVGAAGAVKVVDFGLARADGPAEPGPPELLSASPQTIRGLDGRTTDITRADQVTGTPAYMAPEMFTHAQCDARGDQFAFCVTLYEALFRQRPFAGRSFEELAFAILRGQIAPFPQGSSIPTWLRRVILRGLQHDPTRRFASMDELLTELERDRDAVRRRIALALLGASGLAAATLFAANAYQTRARLCSGARDEVAVAWSDERRAALVSSFAATRLPYADHEAAATARALDDYATAWVAHATDACEDINLRGEASPDMLDRRRACLQRRLDALDALAGVLARADPEVVERASDLVADLEPLGVCDDEAYLLAAVKPPADPAGRARVDALRQQLAHVDALVQAGLYREAQRVADQTWSDAQALPYPPLQAEALYHQARARIEADADVRPDALIDAYHAAFRCGHDEYALRAATRLARNFTYHWHFDDAWPWIRQAEGFIARSPGTTRREAVKLAAIRSQALKGKADFSGALAAAEDAIAGAEALGPAGQHDLIFALLTAADALRHLDRAEEALARRERALDIARSIYPEGHPGLTDPYHAVGTSHVTLGNYEAGIEALETSLRILRQTVAPESSEIGTLLQSLSIAYVSAGRFDDAIAAAEQTLAIYEPLYGEHLSVAQMLFNLGTYKALRGDLPGAVAAMERGAPLFERTAHPDDPDRVIALAAFASVLVDVGRIADARTWIDRAREAARAMKLADDHEAMADLLAASGPLLLAEGRLATACDELRRAIALYERMPMIGFRRNALGITRFLLAQSLWSADPALRDEALRVARDAVATLRDDGPRSDFFRARAEAWLAARPAG